MTPGPADHLFVILVLGLIFPLGGLWAYRRFLERVKSRGDAALVLEYQLTILWLIGLGGGAMLLWLAAGRSLESLGLAPLSPGSADGLVGGLAGGAAVALVLRPILAALSPKVAASVRKQFGDMAVFLPRTGKQLAWGLGVSLAAGLFEEIAYRGLLLAYLQSWLPIWGAVLGSSLLFGLAHLYQGKTGVFATSFLGAGLAFVYLETESLLLPILLHIGIDVSAMVTAWLVLRKEPAAPPEEPVTASPSTPGPV